METTHLNDKTMKESKFIDAEILSERVLKIQSDIRKIEDEIKMKTAPLYGEIKQLEEEYLDKYLIDSTGKPVRKGMIIEKENKRFNVINRYQQCFFQVFRKSKSICNSRRKKESIRYYPSRVI